MSRLFFAVVPVDLDSQTARGPLLWGTTNDVTQGFWTQTFDATHLHSSFSTWVELQLSVPLTQSVSRRWSCTGCCWPAVWAAPGCICRGTFIQSAFSALLCFTPPDSEARLGPLPCVTGLVPRSPALSSTLPCHMLIENWLYTVGATVLLARGIKPESHIILEWQRGTCFLEVQHGLVRVTDRVCEESRDYWLQVTGGWDRSDQVIIILSVMYELETIINF